MKPPSAARGARRRPATPTDPARRYGPRWWFPRSDDGVALLMALFLMVVATALAVAVEGLVISQEQPIQLTQKSISTLGAARAGIDVALGQIRTAYTLSGSTEVGQISKLPCGPFSGAVNSSPQSSYSVTVAYYTQDPTGQSASWLSANKLTCTPGSGTTTVPYYAYITSAGSAPAIPGDAASVANRTLTAVYNFQLTNQNIPGGIIPIYNDGSSGHLNLCMAATSSSPAAGSALVTATCQTGAASQTFAYNQYLQLVLTTTQVGGTGGMCVQDAGSAAATFQPCAASPPPAQEWSFNDVAGFEGTTDGSTLDGSCLAIITPNTVGSGIDLSNMGGNCDSTAYNSTDTWSPTAAVGAGAANCTGDPKTNYATCAATQTPPNGQPQLPSDQLVNYDEFGRCLDVTGQNVNATYLIDFPCKQAPNPESVAWNQRWTYNSTTEEITTATGGTTYCLQSPLTPGSASYVVIEPCPTNATTNVEWSFSGNTGNYATSYNVMDADGYCLDLGQTVYPSNAGWSSIVVNACNGQTSQKWNAPANLDSPAVRNVWEP